MGENTVLNTVSATRWDTQQPAVTSQPQETEDYRSCNMKWHDTWISHKGNLQSSTNRPSIADGLETCWQSPPVTTRCGVSQNTIVACVVTVGHGQHSCARAAPLTAPLTAQFLQARAHSWKPHRNNIVWDFRLSHWKIYISEQAWFPSTNRNLRLYSHL